MHHAPILVLGGTGKTGRRVAQQLENLGFSVRIGSRSANPAFEWNDPSGWSASLEGVEAAYINYAPDLAVPGAADAIAAFVAAARQHGLKRLVLLSGRGEPEAQVCERLVQASGIDHTIVRASWFNQNFSEGAFFEQVQAGEIALPGGGTPEPFVDVDDIAAVIVAALTEARHAGQVYELTGPRLLQFSEVARMLSEAIGRDVAYVDVPHEAFIQGLEDSGAPADLVWLLDYLFATVLDGRNAKVTPDVERVLGRPAKDFADYAREQAAAGTWRVAA